MGGGDGAKERRRLQRAKSTTITDSSDQKLSTPGKSKAAFEKRFIGTPGKGKGYAKQQEKKTVLDKVKVKVKKPKHLKRKLEQLPPDDEQTRKAVLEEMKEFQKRKSEIVKEPDPKRQRSEKSSKTESNLPKHNAASRTKTHSGDIADSRHLPILANNQADEIVEEKKKKNIEEKIMHIDDHSDSMNSDDHLDELNEEPTAEEFSRRERGRRRRGRKDTAKEITEKQQPVEREQTIEGKKSHKEETVGGDEPSATKRYCVGRKPVSDFVVGQKYQGKVVYVKDFGVFFDIGCHSDAFCHVSRLRDDFVEKPQDLLKPGDEVQARVVEIDRKQKRITVSLQSDERVADEFDSVQARKDRKKSRSSRRKNTMRQEQAKDTSCSRNQQTGQDLSTEKKTPVVLTSIKQSVVPTQETSIRKEKKDVYLSSSIDMTPAKQKRARKLARRATRRENSTADEPAS